MFFPHAGFLHEQYLKYRMLVLIRGGVSVSHYPHMLQNGLNYLGVTLAEQEKPLLPGNQLGALCFFCLCFVLTPKFFASPRSETFWPVLHTMPKEATPKLHGKHIRCT